MANFKRLKHAFKQAKRDMAALSLRERTRSLQAEADALHHSKQGFVASFLVRGIGLRKPLVWRTQLLYWKWNATQKKLSVFHDPGKISLFKEYIVSA